MVDFIVALLIAVPVVLLITYFLLQLPADEATPVTVQEVAAKKHRKKKSKKAKNPVQEIIQEQPKKKKNLHKIVPLGKAAYCKYCEVYLMDDEFLETHVKGKKHLKNRRPKDENWYTITDNTEENSVKDHFQDTSNQESDDEWTL